MSYLIKVKKWTNNKFVGLCQWFIIAREKQDVFLKLFFECMKNIDALIHINKEDPNYHYNVLSLSGPTLFTNIIFENVNKKDICILDADYFCQGSACIVPYTDNSYVKHHFIGTWLK